MGRGAGGGGGSFASFADVNGFASAGGAAAALSLATDATALFDMDGLALSLTLTLTAESGEEATGTVTFVSSAREFNGTGLSTLIVTTALAAGTEVFAATDAGLTIWHSPNENETYTLEGANANLFTVGAAGAVSVKGEIRPTELVRYELTLALSDGGVTARRALTVELTPPLLDVSEDLSELNGLRVTVEARATVGDFVWGVAPPGGSFASFANVNGFASAGGSAAALSLATDATALFDMDGLALSLTLTLTAESGEETTGTVTFVSSAREFNGAGLSTLIVTAALAAGTEVFGSSAAGLTIWHSPNENETYTLEGANANLFTVGAAGAVSVTGEIRPTELVRYELTLALSDGGVTARRALTVELTPPLLDVSEDLSQLNGLRVTVAATATVGDFVWGVASAGGMFAPFANVNGFASAGGSAAALSLATDATALFDMDGLALSLTLTLTAESGEEATGTVTFVSSAREFNGTGLSTLIVTAALAAGTEVFAATDAGLTIWHSPNEDESYALEGADAGLFAVGLAGAVSVKGEIRPTELTRYELTLALSDGGVTARRALAVELTPPLLEADEDLTQLRGLTVTVAARATAGDFVWGVMPAAGGSFAPFANVNGFASAGGSAAALSLATDATVLFNADGLALSLTLTLTAESGEETTGTVTFVSSAREFNGTGLSTRIVTAALAAGTEVFAATDAGLTIWHSPNESEFYTLEGANANLFTVGAAGAVSVKGEIRPTELTRYELTLALSDGGVTARRALAVELTPPLLEADEDLTQLRGLTVTVAARATAGDFVWGVMPAAGGSFAPFANVNGFASAGGSAAALSLATDATVLFNADGLALSLTLTLTAESGEETTGTVTFVSSAREFNGTGLSTRIVTAALAAGTEVFAATDAGLTIWHSPNESEFYTLEGANANLFTVGAAGAVSVKGEIRPTEFVRYELTLALSDGGVTARRGLAVELTPPLLEADEDLTQLRGLTVTVAATAKAKDFVWGVMPPPGGSFASFANVNGFASAGGAAAALSLATDATVLFDMDGLALSLTLTLTAESGEEATGTVTFVSSAREFNGTGLSTRIVTAALAAGTEVFAAADAGLTIWHSPNESEFYTLEGANANLFTVGAAGAVSVKGEIRPTELTRYELTLALSDGGVTARRALTVELTPPLLEADEDLTQLRGLTVTVAARAKAKDFVWGVAPAAGGSFAPFANVNGFASAGGAAAALSLATDATALFDMDGLALSLTLTLTAESGEEATGTVTFVSSAREFNGTGLSTLIVTTALAAGTEVFAATDAGLTIWHSPNENETYTLEGANANLFTVGAAGAVSVKGEIRPTELVRYELTLALSDGGVTARRGLTVELTPPLLEADEDLTQLRGLTVTVAARAKAKDFVWGVAPAAGGSFASFANVNGFASAGGAAAALSLATDATVLFDMDGLALSLTLTLTAESGEEATGTVTFVSSAREFNGTGLSTRIVTTALAMGTEVFAAAESGLTIWHSPNESETYTLEGADANLFGASAAGAVSARDEIRPTELTRYELTLALSDGGVTARRGLTVELTPPLLDVSEDLSELNGLRVTVAARATVGDFVWGVMPPPGGSFASFADVNGFASAGGAAAALSLATDATVLFDMDGLALSLTLTLTAESGEEATGTVTFVSSAREFNGTGLSTLIVTTALAAGTEVFGSSDAGLTIWHSPNENETYTLEGANANLFTVGAAGAVSVKGEIRPTELTRYELTLALSDGGVTARRALAVELTPPLLEADEDLTQLRGLTVTVAARAKAKDFVWGVAPAAGGSFAPFANVNGFASAGGSAAALSLATDATVLFNADGLALSLTLTLTAESGEETTGTVTFVSSAREFNGTGLSTRIVTAALAAGTEVFAAADAGLTIWHSPNESEFYTLEGANANLFTVGAAGAVSVKGEIRPTELTRYELTLALSDGGVTARRALAVELTPPLLEADEDLTQLRGLTVTVAARATVGDFVWGVAPAAGGSFASFANVNGFASAGGSAAALSLATDATVLFNADGLALSLTLTLTAESGEEATGTVTFVSSAREFNGTGLSTLIVTAALAAGTEVFAAADAGLTIWHSPNESEFYTLEGANANLFTVGAAGAVSVKGEIRPTELTRYELTLALSDGGVTARRALAVELTPPLLEADEDLTQLRGLTVTVAARAKAKDFVWGVAPAAGGSFASFANVNGFASAGGSAAALSLATDATVLFNADGLALSLTLTLAAESGEEATGTVTFVSSAREFNGTGLSTLIVTAALAAGTEVFAATDAGLTIWHSPNESEFYTLEGANANLFTVGAAGAVSVKGEIRPTELTRYELTLALSDGGVTARRALAVELTPPLLEADEDLTQLRGLTVTVAARAKAKDFVWGVAPAAGGSFASFANVNGFASAGGAAAALSLATDATVLFDMDGLALSLTLTLTAESGEEATGTVTFVSSAREFNGTGLSTRIVTTALAMGTEVFAAAESGLTIWHSPNESETYTLEGANANLFTVGAAGAVSARDEIRPTELTRYELTLALSDGGVTARRGLAVELTPPLLEADEDLTQLRGLTVTVAARAKAKDFVWGVAPAAGGSFASFANVNGFASAGGSAAALSLATDATVLFNADGLALSLTLTLTAESGEEATGTVTFVSSAREFNGTGLSTLIVTTALAAGTEVFAATDAGLTIWHSPNESEFYTLEGANANLFTVGAAGAVSVKGEIRPTELTRYELTLALSDGGVTARRALTVELTPPLLEADEDLTQLRGLTVTVAARAKAKDFVWGVMPPGGSFAPFANVNGFASAGGSAAALSLATDATVLFNADGLALSLTLTLAAESGEEATGTVTFVSSAREFNGTGLSTLIVTAALAAGTEVFAATDAGLTIWHSPNESETYTLEGADANLFGASAAGAVSVKGEIRPTELTRYELTLALSDGGVTARRGLTVELTPPLLEADEDLTQLRGLTVTVAARAKAKDFVWGVAPAAGGSFASFANVNGFASAGGSAAALSLATDATVLFDMDGLALSLTLTLAAESGEEATGTVTFVSSAREFNGTGLSTLIVTAALAAGTEVFAATDAGLTIWHSPNEDESYALEGADAGLFAVGLAGAVSVKGEIRPTELTRYELTLALSDGGVTARRALTVELTPPLLEADEDLTQLRGLTVTVAARATAKDFVWGVAPAAGGSFASFANVNGFASAGGSAAALSLATDATVLFNADGLALSLTLTLTAESGEETTGTVTFVSSAREFNGTGLSTRIVTAALAAGTEVFAAADAGLTIWHSPNESEFYTLEGANANLFTVGAAGAVSVKGEIRPTELTRYELTLALSDGGVTARRALAVELTPPLLEADEDLTQLRGLTVTVAARAKAKDFVWGVAPAAGGSFASFANVNGFASAGGSAAALSLATDATVLFNADGLALSLTLTLAAEIGRGGDGDGDVCVVGA